MRGEGRMRTPSCHSRESRDLQELADFFENAPLAIRCVGPDGTIHWANQAEFDLLGYTRSDYLGHSIAEFHDDRRNWEDMLRRLKRRRAARPRSPDALPGRLDQARPHRRQREMAGGPA